MARFELLRPRLKEGPIFTDGAKLILESAETREHLVLPLDAQPYVELMDGQHTIQEIVESVYKAQGHVKFKTLFTTYHRLAGAGCLVADPSAPEQVDLVQPKTPFEKQSFILERPLLRWYMARRLGAPVQNLALFVISSAFVIGLALWFAGQYVIDGIPHPFLKIYGSYGFGMIYFFAATTLLSTLSQSLNMVRCLLASGRVYNPALVLTPLALTFKIDDDSVYISRSRWVPVLYHLASALTPLAAAGIISTFIPTADADGNLRTIGLFLTLLELNPYSLSSLTKLFHLVYQESLFSHMIPYLRNRALLAFANRKERVLGEAQLLLYSACAVSWSVGSLYLTTRILTGNFPSLLTILQSRGLGAQTGSAVILIYLLGISCYLAIDLLRTVIMNVVFPVTNPLLLLVKTVNSRAAEGDEDLNLIMGVLKLAPLFTDMSDLTVAHLAAAGTVRSYRRGTPIIIQGEPNDHLCVLLEGTVRVERREATGSRTKICELESGAVFGEISALQERPATADVIAHAGHTRILELPRRVLKSIPALAKGQADFDRISSKVKLGHYIASSSLFRDMPTEIATFFSHRGRLETIPSGVELTRQGGADRSLFLLIRGKAEVRRDGVKISEITQGGFFGEIALITGIPRTASVVTTEESLVLRIGSDDLWQVLAEQLQLSLFIEAVAESRLVPVGAASEPLAHEPELKRSA